MGCVQSKPRARRKGLMSQQEDLVVNNNVQAADPDVLSPLTIKPPAPAPSRHSPPASRPASGPGRPELEDVGSLGEIWTNIEKWEGFKGWLGDQSEGSDSEGVALSLERYALFLELYVSLDQEFRSQAGSEHCHNLVVEIATHPQDFLGRERCLKCIDSGLRKSVMLNIKHVREGKMDPSPAVFVIVYQRVVDRLAELLGSYQNYLLKQEPNKAVKR